MPTQPARKARVLVVSDTVPWASRFGGQVRVAGVCRALAPHFDVSVAYPITSESDRGLSTDLAVDVFELETWTEPAGLRKLLLWLFSGHPWGGEAGIRPALHELEDVVRRLEPDFIYWTHSYSAEVGLRPLRDWSRHIVEFANVETSRTLSLVRSGSLRTRIFSARELLRTWFWEPRVVRDADKCVVLSRPDETALRRLGASPILAPNGIDVEDYAPSPDAPVLLTVGSWDYEANADGLRRFLTRDWPQVLDVFPHASLTVAGKGGPELVESIRQLRGRSNILAVGFVPDLHPLFLECALFVAPATSGGGSQLKLSAAAAHGRVTVGPSYLAGETDEENAAFIRPSTEISAEIIRLLTDAEARHRAEESAVSYARRHDWDWAASGLVAWLQATFDADA